MAVVVSCEDQAAGTGLFQWDFYNSGLSGAVHTVIHQDGHTEIVGNHIQNRINQLIAMSGNPEPVPFSPVRQPKEGVEILEKRRDVNL